jgi:hypothetical protein
MLVISINGKQNIKHWLLVMLSSTYFSSFIKLKFLSKQAEANQLTLAQPQAIYIYI